MTSYKLCLTYLVLVSVSVTANSLHDASYQRRVRRDSNGKEEAVKSTTEDTEDYGFQAGYRFGDEFFLPEASRSIPAEYKKKADGCERVVKASMVCMVCKDPKTNAKYEQCSYVGNPPPTISPARRYTGKTEVSYDPESSSESTDSSTPSRNSFQNYESSTPSRGSLNYESSTPSRGSSNYESSTPSRNSEENYDSSASSRGSDENYDSSTPSRGSSENYDSSTPSRGSHENYDSSTPSRGAYETYEASKPKATLYNKKGEAQAPYSYFDNSKDESESSEDPAESTNCRQIVKDSQTCKICKDPKTGKDFEECSSSYQPDDKTYSYGKTEKYSYPESRENDGATDYDSSEKKSESFEEDPAAETSECRKVRKDDQICTICKDSKTGGDSERCSSSYKPADESYAYGTSERYGGPSPHQKSYNDDDKSADATYDNPSDYPKTNDDSYNNYHSELPKEYRETSHGDGSGYHVSNPSYGEYAAPSIPARSTKTSGNGGNDGCREIQKDSMTCTVCTDPKTGGNFEKCSYAYKPDDKVYKFTKSKTFGYPETGETSKEDGKRSTDSVRHSESKQILDAVKAGPCKEIEKDSMICTVCKDLKTGVSSEQCAYGSKPSEKLFTYSASKSFGKPRKEGEERDEVTDQEVKQESRQVARASDTESSQVTDQIRTSPCRKIEKDSMTCTVCKDPKTGASSEQCSYSSKPKGNRYTYSKSKTSGSPRDGAKRTDNERQEPRETKQIVDTVEATNPCRKIEKDSMTCTICKDPKTGENSEQCAYSYKPKERHFTYTKSKSFGNPRKEKTEGDDESQEEKPEESHEISRRLNDKQDYYAKVNRPRGFSKPDWSYHE